MLTPRALSILASACIAGVASIGQAKAPAARTLTGHRARVASVAFSPDGKTLASGSWDNTVKLWDPRSAKLLRTLRGHAVWVQSVAFSPDGRTLASGSDFGTVRIWNLRTGKVTRKLTGHEGGVAAVAFSPDGAMLASGTVGEWVRPPVLGEGDGELWLWDPRTGKRKRKLAENNSIFALAFSADGKTLATAGSNPPKLWDVATWSARRTLKPPGPEYAEYALAFSRDGKTLLSGGEDGVVELWDTATGTLRVLKGHRGYVESVAISPDGQVGASGGGGTVLLRPTPSAADFPEGKPVRAFAELNLWDPATGNLRQTLTGHTASVCALAFSPDGRTLASGSDDRTVRLWNLP